MTQERIRELLSDVADAVPAPDVADRAWRRSVRVRRRRVAGTSLLAAGVVVAVVAVVGAIGDAQPGSSPPDDGQMIAPVPLLDAAKSREPDARIAGAPAWIGPSIDEEQQLPTTPSDLPPSIDLTDVDQTTDAPGRSIAAFASSDSENQLTEILLVDSDGEVSRLDVSELDLDLVEKVDPDSGEVSYVLPLNISSLSPDGESLVLAQNNEVVLFDLVDGVYDRWPTPGAESHYVGWTHTEDKGWQIQLVEELMDPDTGVIDYRPEGDGEPTTTGDPVAVWPLRTGADGRTAQAMVDRPVPKLADELGDDPLLINVDPDGPEPVTLALPVADGDHIRPRSRVVDWLGGDVAFQSQDVGSFRVLGWDTATGAVGLLSEIELPDDWDEGVIASWADVAR